MHGVVWWQVKGEGKVCGVVVVWWCGKCMYRNPEADGME